MLVKLFCSNRIIDTLYNLNKHVQYNQSNIIYFIIHKYMLKKLYGYLGNKVVFVQANWKDNGLLLAPIANVTLGQ